MDETIYDLIKYFFDSIDVNLFDDILDIVILDDLDFYNEVKKYTNNLNLSEYLVLTIPPEENKDNNKYKLLIKDTLLGNNSSYGIEILYTQLSDIIASLSEVEEQIKKSCEKSYIFKNANIGYSMYREYTNIYTSQKLLSIYYSELTEDHDLYNDEHAYSLSNSKKIASDIFNNINEKKYNVKDNLSLMLYAFAKLMIYDVNQKTSFQISTLIKDKKEAILMQKLYDELKNASKTPSIMMLNHMGTITKKILNIFDNRGGEELNEIKEN